MDELSKVKHDLVDLEERIAALETKADSPLNGMVGGGVAAVIVRALEEMFGMARPRSCWPPPSAAHPTAAAPVVADADVSPPADLVEMLRTNAAMRAKLRAVLDEIERDPKPVA